MQTNILADSEYKGDTFKYSYLITLIFYSLLLSIFFSPSVLGLWESSTFFHTFAPEEIWLNTLIHPRAAIGGYEYAFLDLSRHLAYIFNLNLFSLRILPIVYGIISLCFFYQVLIRWCAPFIALFTSGLLAVNPVFLMFQNQLNVSIVTFTTLIFCIWGFHLVDQEKISRRTTWIFAIACALTALHYQIARYIMLAIIFYWFSRGINFENGLQLNELWIFKKDKRKYYLQFLLALFISLIILNPFNFFSFLNPKFLSPPNAEHAKSWADFLQNIKINFPLILHSFLGDSPFYGKYSTDIIVSVPHKLLNLPLFFLVVIGLIGLFFNNFSKRKIIFLLLLLFLTTIPLSLSSLFPRMMSSLSPYRLFYMLIPIYILIAVGLEFIVNILRNKKINLVIYGLLIALIILQSIENYKENLRFEKFVDNFDCHFDREKGDRSFICNLPPSERRSIVFKDVEDKDFIYYPSSYGLYYYREFIVPFRRYAQLLYERVNQIESTNEKIILVAPITDFKETRDSMSNVYPYNFRQIYLALYLSESGIHLNYPVPYPGRKPLSKIQNFFNFLLTRTLDLKSNAGHMLSRIINYPLPIDLETGDYDANKADKQFWERIESKLQTNSENFVVKTVFQVAKSIGLFNSIENKSLPYNFQMRSTNGKISKFYLVTTESEKQYVTKYLSDSNHSYLTVRL